MVMVMPSRIGSMQRRCLPGSAARPSAHPSHREGVAVSLLLPRHGLCGRLNGLLLLRLFLLEGDVVVVEISRLPLGLLGHNGRLGPVGGTDGHRRLICAEAREATHGVKE